MTWLRVSLQEANDYITQKLTDLSDPHNFDLTQVRVFRHSNRDRFTRHHAGSRQLYDTVFGGTLCMHMSPTL